METNGRKPKPKKHGDTLMFSTRLPVIHIDMVRRISEHKGIPMAQVIRTGIELQAKELDQ